MARTSLSIYDFRDTDLMAVLAEQGASGATSHEVGEAMGIKNGDIRGIGIRFAWMKKFGMLAYDEKTHMWTLTDGANRVMESHVRAAAKRTIEAVPDEDMVEVMAHVTSRYRLGDPMTAALLRREFQYGTSPRSAAWRR